MRDLLGDEFDAFEKEYENPRQYGLRVNTLKTTAKELQQTAAPEFTDAGIYLANVQYDKENARYTFKLIVAEYHEKLDIYIYGLIDDDGDKVPVICTTSDELIGDYARVVRPIITVNGEMCENLPTAIDVYDVIVDMSETDLENVDWTNTIYTKELSQ